MLGLGKASWRLVKIWIRTPVFPLRNWLACPGVRPPQPWFPSLRYTVRQAYFHAFLLYLKKTENHRHRNIPKSDRKSSYNFVSQNQGKSHRDLEKQEDFDVLWGSTSTDGIGLVTAGSFAAFPVQEAQNEWLRFPGASILLVVEWIITGSLEMKEKQLQTSTWRT